MLLDSEIYIWLAITVIALITEFLTAEMVSIWFVGGGLVTLLLTFLGLNVYIQVPSFIVFSFLTMFLFRKYVINKFNKDEVKTNADSVIGKEFRLLTKISFSSPGSIKVNDVVWGVITENSDEEIDAGSIVIIKQIKGNKYIVEKKI